MIKCLGPAAQWVKCQVWSSWKHRFIWRQRPGWTGLNRASLRTNLILPRAAAAQHFSSSWNDHSKRSIYWNNVSIDYWNVSFKWLIKSILTVQKQNFKIHVWDLLSGEINTSLLMQIKLHRRPEDQDSFIDLLSRKVQMLVGKIKITRWQSRFLGQLPDSVEATLKNPIRLP